MSVEELRQSNEGAVEGVVDAQVPAPGNVDSAADAPDALRTPVFAEAGGGLDASILASRVAELEAQLAAKEELYQDVHGQLRRLAADFENHRRRQAQEREALVKSAAERVLEQFLEVLDNFERAIQVAERATEPQQVVTGVQMIYKQVLDFLGKEGVTPMDAKGKGFDPNQHEAVLQEESDDQPDQTVLDEFRKGYLLHGRVLRHALVKIANNPSMPALAPASESSSGQTVTQETASPDSVS
ncbi:MAG: nucleotide exchange factor GrpE [Candidatus Sericytochromatia bacterium]|nr:nucleotide exchange factor GrpE [Candidatus Sericytochromatia bacterium]